MRRRFRIRTTAARKASARSSTTSKMPARGCSKSSASARRCTPPRKAFTSDPAGRLGAPIVFRTPSMTIGPFQVTDFWFGPKEARGRAAERDFWFKQSTATDDQIRLLFGPVVEAGLLGKLRDWSESD